MVSFRRENEAFRRVGDVNAATDGGYQLLLYALYLKCKIPPLLLLSNIAISYNRFTQHTLLSLTERPIEIYTIRILS